MTIDINRDAARLFVPAQGMRVCVDGRWVRVGCGLDEARESVIDAIDADDPATVGAMIAQVEHASAKPLDLWSSASGPVPQHPYVVDTCDGILLGTGPTRGASLVSAMKAVKGDPTR